MNISSLIDRSARQRDASYIGRLYDATWGRAFAAYYDREVKAAEEGGLGRMRAELLGAARGTVLEIGAGTGINLAFYPDAVDELLLVEPDRHMARRLRSRLSDSTRTAEIFEAPAEKLPFSDAAADTVVATFALCTIPHPSKALAEAARILKSDGRLLFIEHVRSEECRLARWQDRLEKPWRFLGDGCYCNRDTLAAIAASRFQLERVERGRMPKAPAILSPLAQGSAVVAT